MQPVSLRYPSAQRSLFSFSARRSHHFGLLFIFLLLALPSLVFAADDEDEVDEREPQLGTIAGSVIGSGFEGVAVGAAGFRDEDAFTESKSPITGSVSRLGKRNWVARLFNNSENTYSVTIRVQESDKRGNNTRGVSYSAVVKGGQKWERKFTARTSTEQAKLELTSFRNLTPKKKRKRPKAKRGRAEKTQPLATKQDNALITLRTHHNRTIIIARIRRSSQ